MPKSVGVDILRYYAITLRRLSMIGKALGLCKDIGKVWCTGGPEFMCVQAGLLAS